MTRASRLAIFGTTLGVAGIFGNGTPEQIVEWVPQCFGTPEKLQHRRLRASASPTRDPM